MIEYIEGQGINFTELLKDSDPETGKDSGKIPEALTGQEVAGRVGQIFDQLPSEIRQYLVDSNVVLTMAGAI